MALEQFYGRIVDLVRRSDGDELTAAAGIADTVLHIGDTADFDETGGTVEINGDRYTYGTLDHDANTITLDTGLLAAAAVGDRVDVVDEELNEVVVEYVANVLMEDQDPGDRPIEVTVQHGLVNYLSEQVRGGSTEAVALLRDGDDDLVIWQVEGKLVTDLALEAVQGGYAGTLQDIYDAANQAAADAAAAEYTATVAQATADGKNTVTYSNSDPGSTPNKAGDVWFQRDGTPSGGIIAQFEGQGGTSWASRALRNEVIANLDAGKITAGTAFTNALHVKTNFTLGDAAVNGIIQSYDFAGSPVGIYLDKNGIVAKGGSIAGATITGGEVTGATVQTASSGRRIMLYGGAAGVLECYTATAFAGYLSGVDFGGGVRGIELLADGDYGFIAKTSGTNQIVGDVNMSGYDMTASTFNGTLTGNTNGTHTGAVNGGAISGTTGDFSGELHGNTLWSDTQPTDSSSANVFMGASGKLQKSTASSRRYKEGITDADIDVAAVLAMRPRFFRYKKDYYDSDQVFAGFIAEELLELGLDKFVDFNEDGEPENVRYAYITVAQQAVLQRQQAQIEALTARLDAAGL